ncbi:MAG: hypothetical protein OS130_10065 [Thermodesulfobacteriota bacterium]|nr:MAG: hypothetical protein OS130_10065 [Thermodesulfobacteriota bacterium]
MINFKKYFIWFVIAAFVIVGGRAAYADYQAMLRQKVIPCGYWEPTRDDLRKAMRYHGILIAQEDEDHQWFFIRDGKRCRLFAYLKTVKRKA